jgi:methylsterol monooxygenase
MSTPFPQQYSGKQHRWAEKSATRNNNGLKSLAPVFGIIALTVCVNKSATARAFYAWLNDNYTPFQINAWWTFAITTAVYWFVGGIFLVVDLVKPAFLHKYKIQPAQSVTPKDYIKVCWIVARNQVSFCAE